MNSPISEEDKTGRKVYSTQVHAKAFSSTSCSFCWLILNLYPALEGMTGRDGLTFREHLKKSHGLTGQVLQ